MTYPMGVSDETAILQNELTSAASARKPYTLAAGGHRLSSTGLGYSSDARIVMIGDLYNDHGPSVGTLYCLTNRTSQRLRNVTIQGQGGAFVGSGSDPAGAVRKGLGIVATDGFTVVGAQTSGPLTGFGMEIKNSTGGYLSSLKLLSGVNKPGADGLHFFGACSKISGGNINVASGDDAISFTCENNESTNALMERIILHNLKLDSAAFSCIKFYTSSGTGKSTIRNIQLSNITGRITQGPTGCPLIMQNMGVSQGCVIDDVTITNADLDFGAASADGPTAFLTDVTNIRLIGIRLRGRRNGQFLRAIRCQGLTVTGEVWETIAGNSVSDMIQLEKCGNYDINLVVRSSTGARIGVIKTTNTGTDATTRYIGITGT